MKKYKCKYINKDGKTVVRLFDNMDLCLAFCAKLDERIEKGTCQGYQAYQLY